MKKYCKLHSFTGSESDSDNCPDCQKVKSNPHGDVQVCELCETDYLEKYDDDEPILVEEYENLEQWGRCTDCIGEYGTDGYPDR